MSRANLEGTRLTQSTLIRVDLTGARLAAADLSGRVSMG